MKMQKFLCCILLTSLLFTACTEAAPGEHAATQQPLGALPENWLPNLTVEYASPTGATILFQQVDNPGSFLLLCGNDYVLQRYENGNWQDLPTLQDSVFWTQAAFVVTAIPRDNIDWEWLYGTLSPGRYRIGKTITLSYNGESKDSEIAYGEFTIEGTPAETPTVPGEMTAETEPEDFQPIALYSYSDLSAVPASYSHKDAALDHCVVLSGSNGVENRDLWLSFFYRTQNGEQGTVRMMDYDITKGTQSVYDVTFDGLHYTVSWMEKGEKKSLIFKHLLKMQGDLYNDPNATDRYVLTMDKNVTWDDIQWGMVSDNPNDAIAHKVVYQERSYHPSAIPIPESQRVSMSLRGKELKTVTGDSADQMVHLFAASKVMDRKPDMYYKGLDLIFYGKDGNEMTLWLSLYGDVFLYDGNYYSYSTQEMFKIFGITDWPEELVFPKG